MWRRRASEGIARGRARAQDDAGQLVVVAEEGRQLRSEGDARLGGKGSEVDQQVRLLSVRLGERVAENEASLGVGVADLDRQALARLQHVERPERIAGEDRKSTRLNSSH